MELFDRFEKLSYKIAHLSDEEWEYTEEPHVSRRQQILAKYPQVKKLMGSDHRIAYIVAAEVFLQLLVAYFLRNSSFWVLLPVSYIVGASLNHSLGSAIHEIGHNLAFGHKYPLWNRALGMFANLPMVVPLSVTYKKYHSDHHRYLGEEERDVDIPLQLESKLFRHWSTKMLWLLLHPAIHGLRPYIKNPQPATKLEIINFIVQMIFNVIVLKLLGAKSLLYLLIGTFFGLGFHPLAGHFISEHYLFHNGHKATYSYYGPLNAVLFNVGYHVEHHDFPYIPYTRLPQLRQIASEFYQDLPHHTSWLQVLFDFIFDPSMGPSGRAVGYTTTKVD